MEMTANAMKTVMLSSDEVHWVNTTSQVFSFVKRAGSHLNNGGRNTDSKVREVIAA